MKLSITDDCSNIRLTGDKTYICTHAVTKESALRIVIEKWHGPCVIPEEEPRQSLHPGS